jgi:hypothetical protein
MRIGSHLPNIGLDDRKAGLKNLLSGLRRFLLRDPANNAKPLVFVHIPKTAGTTLRPIIDSHYKPTDLILGYPSNTDDDLDLSQLLNGYAKCYYGHFYMDIDICPENFVCVSVIRDPVERIISHYYHIVRDTTHWQHRLVVDHGYSLADHALGVDNNREIDNGQLRQLAGLPADLTIDEPVFAAARRKILRTYALVGTTENLNDFVVRLSQLMGWQQPAQYENRNVGNYEAGAISQELVRAIRERNRWDQRLYGELAVCGVSGIASSGWFHSLKPLASRLKIKSADYPR